MIQRFNLLTLIGALVLFFLPWVEFRCMGKLAATQNGVQSIYGGYSVGSEFPDFDKEVDKAKDRMSDAKENVDGMALFAGGAFLAILIGVGVGLMRFLKKDQSPLPFLLSMVAAGLLITQVVVGFPIEQMAEQTNNALRELSLKETVTKTIWVYVTILVLFLPLVAKFVLGRKRR